MNWHDVKIRVNDLWDGRMILSLFDAITAGETVNCSFDSKCEWTLKLYSDFALSSSRKLRKGPLGGFPHKSYSYWYFWSVAFYKVLKFIDLFRLFDIEAEYENPFTNLPWMYQVITDSFVYLFLRK